MVIIKNKVTNGVEWRPVSHEVSLKGVFDCSGLAKKAKKVFWGSNSVVLVMESIKTIWNLFIFLRKDSACAKRTNSTKSTKPKQTIFISLKVFAPAENCYLSYFCLLIFLLLVCFLLVRVLLVWFCLCFCALIFVFLVCFILVSVFARVKSFHKKNETGMVLMVSFSNTIETLCFIFISFPISESFISNFCGTNYDLSSKTTYPLYLKSYSMVFKISKLFWA